jgi:hypothetical protein
MTAEAQASDTVKPARARRHDAGTIRLSQRDIDGLLLCGEHYGAPLDLLAGALGVSQVRMNAIATRWRRAGYVDATAAYVALRSAWARSEAYADVTAVADDTSPLPVTPAAAGSLADPCPRGDCTKKPIRRTAPDQ